MNQSATLVIACIVCIGAGVGIGWALKPKPATAVDDELETTEDGAPDDVTTRAFGLDSPKAREGRLVQELEAARAEAQNLRIQRDALKEQLAELDPEGELTGDGPEGAGTSTAAPPRFVLPGTARSLHGIDWKTAGNSLSKMTPMIDELLESLGRGSRDKMHLQGRIQQLNAPLVTEAVKMSGRKGLSGGGINGVFTHPAVQINFIHSTLEQADLPLDEDQESRLLEIGDRYLAEEKSRLERYDETSFELQKLLDESNLKSHFYRDVDAILTADQVNALHPERVRGRIQADLFSAGLLWAMKVEVVGFQTRDDIATRVAEGAAQRLGIPEEHKITLLELAQDFANGFPENLLAYQPDELDKLGLVRVDRINAAAPHTLDFFRAILDRIPMDDEAAQVVRSTGAMVLPQRSGG